MRKTIKKTLTLAVVAGALAALAIPSMASAANWAAPLANQNLNPTSSLSLTVSDPGGIYALACTGGGLGVRVRTPASSTLDITTAAGYTCTGASSWSGCTVTMTPNGLPWTASGASTTNVTLNSVNYTALFSGVSCVFKGGTFVLQGSLTGGVWSPLGSSLPSVTYNNDSGLSLTGPGGYNRPATATATFTDPSTNGFLYLI